MKYIKYVIVGLVLVLIAIVLLVLNLNKNNNNEIENEIEEEYTGPIFVEGVLNKVTSIDDFVMVETCINQFIYQISEQENEAAYSLLEEDFVKKYDITEENILSRIKKFDINQRFVARTMYYGTNDLLHKYYVYGTTRNYIEETATYQPGEELFIVVNVDMEKQIFNIELEIEEGYFEVTNEKQLKPIKEDLQVTPIQISKQTIYNTIEYKNVELKELLLRYFNDFTILALSQPEASYNMLNSTYRTAKFSSLDSYKEYIKDNTKRFNSTYIVGYYETDMTSHKEYRCYDNFGNYFIITEYGLMDYKLTLDTYTIESDTYKENYAKAIPKDKIRACIDKYLMILNTKSYEQAYNLLDENFKQNNFPTQASFKQYIEEKLFGYNEPRTISITSEGDIHICEVTVSDKYGQTEEVKSITFYIKLLEGTGFVLSFGQ